MFHFPERGVACLLAGILLLGGVPWRARADQRQIIPSLDIRTVYDSNAFNRESVVLGDLETTLSPQIEFREVGDWGRVQLRYRLNRRLFKRFSVLDSTDQAFSAEGTRRLSPRLSLTGNADFGLFDNVNGSEITNDLTVGDTASFRTGAGTLGFRYRVTPRTTFGLTANGSLIRNKDKRRFNTTSAGAQLSLQHSVSRLSSVSLQLGLSKSRFDSQSSGGSTVCLGVPLPGLPFVFDPFRCPTPNQNLLVPVSASQATRIDNRTVSLRAAWNRRWTPAWRSTLTLGFSSLSSTQRTSLSNSLFGSNQSTTKLPASMTFTGGFTLTHRSRLGALNLSFNRQTRPSNGEGTTLDVNSFGLSYTRQLSRRLSFALNGNLQQALSSFSGTGATGSSVDTQLTSLEGRLSWTFSKRLQAFLSVNRTDQTVTGTLFSQSFNEIVTTLGFRYNFPFDLP